ncbi:hypothetical protein NB537_19190 [Vibrio parahaemolyticus]|nr:hypothetical protein [Vibrio parahaemolyticus]MCR9656896.1 hypothetical protein [Vibrio parahaemolyticus]
MSQKKILITLLCFTIAIFLVVLIITAVMNYFDIALDGFNQLTQNFQNLAIPLVTALSVGFLYSSITENTKQTKILRLDELINGHIDVLERYYKTEVSSIPFIIQQVLSEHGRHTGKWDTKRLVLQVNAFLCHEGKIAHSSVSAAVHDYLKYKCFVSGQSLDWVLSDPFSDIVALLCQRQDLELDENRNLYIFKKLDGIAPLLEYVDMLDDEDYTLFSKRLVYPNKELSETLLSPSCTHEETLADFSDRIKKFESLTAEEILRFTKEDYESWSNLT